MPFGREGSALELVHDVDPERGYTYTMISRTPGDDQTGRDPARAARPEPDPLLVRGAVPPHEGAVPLVRGPIYRFINKQNEASMRASLTVADRSPRVPR